MKLLEARVNGNPRQVSTKFGEKSVMDVVTTENEEITIWRPAGDLEVMGRMNGERVSIAKLARRLVVRLQRQSVISRTCKHQAPSSKTGSDQL